MNVSQKLYNTVFSGISRNYMRLGAVLLVGLGFCLLSLVAGVVLGLFDKRAERITKRKTGDGLCPLPSLFSPPPSSLPPPASCVCDVIPVAIALEVCVCELLWM